MHLTARERTKFRAAHRIKAAELIEEESLDALEKVETEIAAYIQLHTKHE